MDKRVSGADTAIAELRDGATILMGGFGLCRIPEEVEEKQQIPHTTREEREWVRDDNLLGLATSTKARYAGN